MVPLVESGVMFSVLISVALFSQVVPGYGIPISSEGGDDAATENPEVISLDQTGIHDNATVIMTNHVENLDKNISAPMVIY